MKADPEFRKADEVEDILVFHLENTTPDELRNGGKGPSLSFKCIAPSVGRRGAAV